MGDPAGIGPEIALSAVADRRVTDVCEPVLYGPRTAADRVRFRPGELSAAAGRVALEAVERAAADAMAGRLDAIATGPIHKEALALAGSAWRGHTELLADLTPLRRRRDDVPFAAAVRRAGDGARPRCRRCPGC